MAPRLGFPDPRLWEEIPGNMEAYEERQKLPYPWEEELPPMPPVIFDDPLWRCTYCGVSDKALEVCPRCGAPRHWR